MKANHGARPLLLLAAATLAALAGACSEKRVVPVPTPTPTARPLPPPPPAPSRPVVSSDWRDAPITPGDWTWGMEGGDSVARFAGGRFALRCDRAQGTVTLSLSAAAAPPAASGVPVTITTTSGVRTLSGVTQAGFLDVTLRAMDPVIDAMIFSRGRFAVSTAGLPTLYVPSWPEVGRVAEDCR